jgi:2-amino-4-hydroxy-6-hydroxymethyldihydropteridine diphosphokinase
MNNIASGKMKNSAIIGLGSNIQPTENIEKAKMQLQKEFQILKMSNFLTTKPIGIPNAPDFINGAILIETDLDRKELTQKLKSIEDILGRVRSANKFISRTIDLDIIVWNKKVVDENYYKWDFLKKFVHEIYPNFD